MPSAPDNWAALVDALHGTADRQRVVDWRPGQHRDAHAQRTVRRCRDGTDGIAFETSVDDLNVDVPAIERRCDRDQTERHRVEDRARIVENDSRLRHQASWLTGRRRWRVTASAARLYAHDAIFRRCDGLNSQGRCATDVSACADLRALNS